MKIHSFLQRWC